MDLRMSRDPDHQMLDDAMDDLKCRAYKSYPLIQQPTIRILGEVLWRIVMLALPLS
jgi:hypothetical protein